MLPCTRAEAEALASATDPFPGIDEPPVLNTLEPDESKPEEWLLEAYTEASPMPRRSPRCARWCPPPAAASRRSRRSRRRIG